METKCSNVLLHARVRVVSTVFEERLDEYRCRSVIGERIVCLFAHENKLKKKKLIRTGNQTCADKGACWWLHEKKGELL